MRSTGQVGPAWTMPWMPVPGWAAGVPQAATIRARAIDTIRNVIDNLVDYDAGVFEKFRPVQSPLRPEVGFPSASTDCWATWFATGDPSPGKTTTGVPTGAQLKRILTAESGTWMQP